MSSPLDQQLSLTPFVMKVGGSSCPRWVDHQLYGPKDYEDPFHRWNVRAVLLDQLFAAHNELTAPRTDQVDWPPNRRLLPEEQWFLEHFISNYCEMFSTSPGVAVAHNCERATTLRSRGVKLGGAVDLLLKMPDGNLQLRQFELWGRGVEADPMISWELALAVLRLRTVGAVTGPLLISHVNLSTGDLSERWIDLTSGSDSQLNRIAQRLDSERGEIQRRSSPTNHESGSICGLCSWVNNCAEWADLPELPPRRKPRNPYVGRVVSLTPTSVETWQKCPRWFRARHLLGLPDWPTGPRGRQGILVHERLADLHGEGTCSNDPERRIAAATIDGHFDSELGGYIERHARRCPGEGHVVGIERDLARLLPTSPAPAMVTARIDMIWSHGGVLDARDYKTGLPRVERVEEEMSARLQAFVLAPLARNLGLKLRIRHEHLSDATEEDPDVFEPDEEELDDISAELAEISNEIDRSDFTGVSDSTICRRCPYQRSCPDSAADPDELIVAVDEPRLTPEIL